MFKTIIYAILLGTGMAACLSQNDKSGDDETASSITEEIIPTTTPQPATPSPEQLQIRKGQVGFIAIGESIEQMRQNIPAGFAIADTTLSQEGMQSTAYIVRPEQIEKGILVEQQCSPACKVWRLNIKSDAYKTVKGIRVGSTYEQVQAQHPISTVLLADGGLVAVAREGGLTFVLNEQQVPAQQRARLTPETVPAETQVKSILIY